jgi:hypothetical protein
MYTHAHTHKIHTRTLYTHTHTHTHTHTNTHAHTHTHAHMQSRNHARTHKHTHTHTQTVQGGQEFPHHLGLEKRNRATAGLPSLYKRDGWKPEYKRISTRTGKIFFLEKKDGNRSINALAREQVK